MWRGQFKNPFTIEIKVRKLLPIVESQRLYLLRAFPTRFSINKGFHFSPTALAKSVKWVLFKIHNSIYFPAILPQAMTEITVRTLNRSEVPGNIIVFASERLCMALWHKSRQPNVEEKTNDDASCIVEVFSYFDRFQHVIIRSNHHPE